MKCKKVFQTKFALRNAQKSLNQAESLIEGIRDHFDCEWGDNAHCDLDLDLTSATESINQAYDHLEKVLEQFRGQAVRPTYPRQRQVPLDQRIGLKDLPLVW
jgi:hypothetical protein